ncbi:MAG: hypothetical protein K0R65_704 [Crocinitomicaceae bacterium]|jgi:hypothetical protein|nr:hypothetical protein [Crocinitomicaceae bacterium]
MAFTFHIHDTSNPKAKAFLEYIKTLDFISVEPNETEEFKLSSEHLKILNQRRENRLSGKSQTFSWEDVQKTVRSKRKS